MSPGGGDLFALEARAFKLARWCSHNFWVLRGPRGEWLGELHGLATDRRTGRPVPIGYARWHALWGWHFTAAEGVTLCRPNQPFQQVYTADEAQVSARWQAALRCLQTINHMDLDYPRGGVRLWGGTCNSNSVFSTFAIAMGLVPPRFPGLWQPGLARPIAMPSGGQLNQARR